MASTRDGHRLSTSFRYLDAPNARGSMSQLRSGTLAEALSRSSANRRGGTLWPPALGLSGAYSSLGHADGSLRSR